MIRWIKTRLIVENPVTHQKIYPTILTATTQHSYPFSVSTANIQIASNVVGSTSSYISQLQFDHIVQVQVSIKMNPNERTVWQNIFEGRIVDMDCEYGTDNNTVLYCKGHEMIAEKALIEETKVCDPNSDARTVLSYFAKYVPRLTYSASYADSSIILPSYDSTADQTFITDLFADMEKVSSMEWMIGVYPTYSGGNLSTVYLTWKPFQSTPTDKYAAKEGTYRVLKANFSVEGDNVITKVVVKGSTPTGGTQVTNSDEDAALSTLYGKRTDVEAQNWVTTAGLCKSIATGLLTDGKVPEISGQVEMIGTPEAHVGDLVTCKFKSIDLNGAIVSVNLHAKRVQHKIDGDEYTTSVDFRKVKKTAYDYVGMVSKVAKCCKKNQCK